VQSIVRKELMLPRVRCPARDPARSHEQRRSRTMSAEIVLDLAARRNAKQNDQLVDEIFELLTRCGVTWAVPRDHPDVLLIRDILAQAKRVIRAK
jgi:hypothetical protein